MLVNSTGKLYDFPQKCKTEYSLSILIEFYLKFTIESDVAKYCSLKCKFLNKKYLFHDFKICSGLTINISTDRLQSETKNSKIGNCWLNFLCLILHFSMNKNILTLKQYFTDCFHIKYNSYRSRRL